MTTNECKQLQKLLTKLKNETKCHGLLLSVHGGKDGDARVGMKLSDELGWSFWQSNAGDIEEIVKKHRDQNPESPNYTFYCPA